MSTLTPLEERLTAALAARAEQVQPHHLRDVPAPTPDRDARVLPLRRRRVAIALAAAAACAAVVAGVVWSGLGDDGQDVPQPAPSPSVPTEVPDDVGADWGVRSQVSLDLDGDGTREVLRLRDSAVRDGGAPQRPGRVDAVLSSTDELTYGTYDNQASFAELLPATFVVDADSDGDQEAIITRVSAESAIDDWLVVDLVGGYLVEVPRSEEAPLTTQPVRDDDRPGDQREFFAFAARRWVQDGTLYSSRSVDSYATTGLGGSFDVPTVYRAEVWAWRIVEGRLVPEPQPQSCVDNLAEGDAPPTRPCADGETDAVPGFYPEQPATIGVGQSASLGDVDFDQRPDTLGLEGPEGDVEEGEAELVLRLSGAGEQRVPLPAGGTPLLYPRTIQIGMLDGASLLVVQESGDGGVAMSYLATGAAGFAEPPIVRPTRGAPFGTGVDADGTAWRTWVGPDDGLFTRVGAADADADTPVEVFGWRYDGRALVASLLGTFCFDDAAGTARRC